MSADPNGNHDDLPDAKQVYEEHGPRLLRYIRRFLGDFGHAEDCLQEVLVIYHKSKDSIREVMGIRSWLYTTARHVALACAVKASRQPKAVDHVPESCVAPLDMIALRDEVQKMLSRMDEKERVAVISIYFEGKSLQDFASESEEPVGTVRKRVQRALLKLRLQLGLDS